MTNILQHSERLRRLKGPAGASELLSLEDLDETLRGMGHYLLSYSPVEARGFGHVISLWSFSFRCSGDQSSNGLSPVFLHPRIGSLPSIFTFQLFLWVRLYRTEQYYITVH